LHLIFTGEPVKKGIHNKQQRPSGAELIVGDGNPIILPSIQFATWLQLGAGRALFINRALVALVGGATLDDIAKIGVEQGGGNDELKEF
jgi:hypothetical protein